jgi:hypothetical protein
MFANHRLADMSGGNDSRTLFQTVNITSRHKVETVFTETHNLRLNMSAIAAHHITLTANHRATANRFKCQPNHARQSTFDHQPSIIPEAILVAA